MVARSSGARAKSGSGGGRYVAAAVIVSAAVFAVVSPCNPRTWRAQHAAVAMAAIMAVVLFADDTRVAVVASLAIAAVWLHWKSARGAQDGGAAPETFSVGAPHAVLPRDDAQPPVGLDVVAKAAIRELILLFHRMAERNSCYRRDHR